MSKNKPITFNRGDLVRHVSSRCIFIFLQLREDGSCRVEKKSTGETYTCNVLDLSLKSRAVQEPPPFDMEEEKASWERVKKHHGWIACPKILWQMMDLEEWGFLCFLIDWMRYMVSDTLLKANEGEFYCPEKKIMEQLPHIGPNTRRRLFAKLKERGFVTTRMVYGTMTKKDGGLRHDNHRMVRIHFDRIEKAVRKLKSKELRTLGQVADDFLEGESPS